jgi:DNA-binding beta-propeller fold protein YncE
MIALRRDNRSTPGRRCRFAIAIALSVVIASQLSGQSEVGGPAHTTLVYPPFAHTLGIHRARSMHLKLFLGDRTRFDNPQGVTAVKFASDDDPEVKGDDFQLTLFGVNAGRGEILYNSTMQTLAVYGGEGEGEAKFQSPRGIEATVDGRVYVADTGNRRVARLRWDPIGRSLTWVGSWPAGEPYDVAADARGQLFVANHESGAVLRFPDPTAGADTDLLPPSPINGDQWPLPADAHSPIALAVGDSLDPWYNPKEYRLYLIDLNGGRLRAINASGEVMAETTLDMLDRPTDEPGRFGYVELDYYGNVYVSDQVSGVLYKFDSQLRPLVTFSGPGPAEDALDEPRGVAIWRRFGQVFVAEREGAQYFFVGTDFEPRSGPIEIRRDGDREIAFDLFLTEAALITAAFVSAEGDTLAIVDAGVHGVGPQTVSWAPSEWKSPPAEGWHERAVRVLVEARPTYSSRRRFSRIRDLELAWTGHLTPSSEDQ